MTGKRQVVWWLVDKDHTLPSVGLVTLSLVLGYICFKVPGSKGAYFMLTRVIILVNLLCLLLVCSPQNFLLHKAQKVRNRSYQICHQVDSTTSSQISV